MGEYDNLSTFIIRTNKITIILQTEGKKSNIRALLCSLHTVVWENCRWTKCDMGALVEPAAVKKAYRKACLAIHPDKVDYFYYYSDYLITLLNNIYFLF